MKIPEKLPPVPSLTILSARWQAVCGRCLARSSAVSATTAREAWNEIASTEGWCVYEPPALSGMTAEPYPVCLKCAEAELSPQAAPARRRRKR